MKPNKMHLAREVVAERGAARRLAWWIANSCSGKLPLAAKRGAAPSLDTLQRLLAGEIIPGEELVRPITIGNGDRPFGARGLDWQPCCDRRVAGFEEPIVASASALAA